MRLWGVRIDFGGHHPNLNQLSPDNKQVEGTVPPELAAAALAQWEKEFKGKATAPLPLPLPSSAGAGSGAGGGAVETDNGGLGQSSVCVGRRTCVNGWMGCFERQDESNALWHLANHPHTNPQPIT